MRLAEMAQRALTGVKGAARYAEALASGDWADDAAIEHRRSTCRACRSRVRLTVLGESAESDWCGEPLVETETTCGCLIFAATAVGSKACPQGKW
jgi:hypothetical protein